MWGSASGKIDGFVIDAVTNQPLSGANIVLAKTGLGSSTDNDGNYIIRLVPTGLYTLRISYIGYKTEETKIEIKDGENVKKDIKLTPVSIEGQTIIITAQASGQNTAINQQLSSDKIVSVVSADRIQELPDVNAAESVGRLPGVSLVRSGGEGTGVVLRGLQPKYNRVMIDGVEMATTNTNSSGVDAGDRGTDLSMISSNMLEGIEVFKTATPDMDAAFLGGVVNFQIKEANKSNTGIPKIGFLLQGGYNNLQSVYKDYKSVANIEDRFFDERLGVFAQAIIEEVNRTSDEFGGSYALAAVTPKIGVTNPIQLNSLNLSLNPRDRKRYDGTLVLDYKIPDGKIAFMNVFSQSNSNNYTRSQNYSLSDNTISFGEGSSPNILNTLLNILDYQQTLLNIKVDAKLSHTYSENISPDTWSMDFLQKSAGTGSISQKIDPIQIAQQSLEKTNPSTMVFNNITTSNSFTRERNFSGSLDLERVFNFSDLITSTLKMGGQYKFTYRDNNYSTGTGTIYNPGNGDARLAILQAFPWMTQAPYNINPNGTQNLPITVFLDPKFNYGHFLSGDYSMGTGTNLDLIKQAVDIVRNIGMNKPGQTSGDYSPNFLNSGMNAYSGNEYRTAAYIMATVNFGPQITLIPGVRYQGLKTSYTAPRYFNGGNPPAYPQPIAFLDTTITQEHDYLLPDISLRYRVFVWLDLRLAYTNTITYPDYTDLTPKLLVSTNSVSWNNFELKPALSQNYDAQISVFDNSIGLLTAGGFLKRIDNLIFDTGKRYITDPTAYPGLPSYTKGYIITTAINNPFRVDVWGMEFDWQTHFWYLPDPLKGLVMNVNYTHIFSGAKYPYTIVTNSGYPHYTSIYVDTSYTDRLINQPNDIINLSVGYDYMGFSTRASMQYQANVFNTNNFWPELRSYKIRYLRWDLSIKQSLPWFGLEAYFDINNLNSANDTYTIQGSGFPSSEQDYGLTADLGFRWKL
jgi:TonB-dependent receptor